MFCLACGAELAAHLAACPNCGTPVRRIESVNEAEKAAFAATESPATATPAALAAPGQGMLAASAAPVSPSISAGDLSNSLVPRDTVGRVVLGTTLAMAVDVLAPWVTVGQLQLPLVRLGAPMVLLLVALALPLAALRPTLRRQPIWAALPLTVGAVCLGAGVGMWAVLTWLAPRVSFITTNVSAPEPTTLTFTPAIGLYLFLAASALLALSGYQFFLAARDAQLREAYVVRSPSEIPFPYTLYALQPGAGVADLGNGAVLPINNGLTTTPPPAWVAAPAEAEAAPPPPAAATDAAPPPAPILPGTAAWNQPWEGPTINRHPAPGAGFSRPLGPRGGR